ncbi:MAG TPA: bacteriohemerythrin [Chromatiales bacterium]|nr:bacteriohemerythrin [Chromatiales bacterium]
MKNTFGMGVVTLLLGVLLVAVIIGFISFGATHPAPWIFLAVALIVPFLLNRMENRHFVVWKDDYSVGIESIDNDHKKLLNLINKLQTAIHYHTGELFERQALDELVNYTKYHFSREEELMQKYGYPELEEHRAEHAKMIAKVGGFVEQYEQKQHGALEDVAEFLKNWLVNHINGTDKRYSAFLIEKGAK